jgi:hypothetical protein
MLQCYRCRRDLAPEMIQRRTINTGRSIGGKGFHNYYRQVVMCSKCAIRHDRWQAFRPWSWVLVVAVLGIIGLLIWLKLAYEF